MHLNVEEVREIQNQVQRVSYSVTLNEDGSFTCRRPYDPTSTVEQFAADIEEILTTAREGKIEIVEKKIEGAGPFFILYFLVRFKPLR